WAWSGIGLLMIAIEVGLLYIAVLLWRDGLITIGDFVLIQAYLLVLFERLAAIQLDLKRVFTAFADAGEMIEIMETPHEVKDIPNAKQLAVSAGAITLTDVDFYFNQTNPVLEKFNLAIKGG